MNRDAVPGVSINGHQGIGQSARRKAIAGSAAVTAASSSTSAVPAF
jgi:hypothetical protein